MSKKNEALHKDIIQFVEKATQALPAKSVQAQKDILQILGYDIAAEDVSLYDPKILADAANIHWEMAKEREKGEPKIRIHSPKISDGAASRTVIDIVSDDFSFLVDSVVAEINRHNLLIDLLLHPIAYVEYDNKGDMKRIQSQRDDALTRQSHIHVQIKNTVNPDLLAELEKGLYTALEDVYYANRDWRNMLDALKTAREELSSAQIKTSLREIEKYCAFLDYIGENNFTLLGYRHYEFKDSKDGIQSKIMKGEGLGLLADDVTPAYISENAEGLPRNLQELRRKLEPVSISKTNRISTVHRRVPMDAIAIKTYNDKGEVIGEKLFIGLFTSVTYSRSVSSVPYIREKVEEVIDMAEFLPNSHDGKALRHILEKYPRDELFQISKEELYKTALSILKLQERQRIALFMRQDPFGRYISCLVYIPRDRFGSDLRAQIISILEQELQGECSNFYTTLDDSVFARVMIVMKVSQAKPPKYNAQKIETLLQEAGQTWPELLSGAVMDATKDPDEVTRLSVRYGEAFPISYTSRYRAKQAVFDIQKIEDVIDSGTMSLDLYKPEDIEADQLRLKIYHPDEPMTLSDVLPILDNMGLRSIAELPFEIHPKNLDKTIWIHDFLLETSDIAGDINIVDVKKNFERAFGHIWYDRMENDSLNALALSANMNWHEISMLRTYVHYLKQIRVPFSTVYIEKALTDHPRIARMIVDLFKALHNPANGNKAEAIAKDVQKSVESALEAVESLDQDRILRMIVRLINATMRTNYYQRDENGHAMPYMAIKIDCRAIAEMPDPKPFREIFVYSPQVEATHLRSDMIARGGLRWSDRLEDYRTEVLGLIKAQMVKNAVIVPMGSKGGFVVKIPTKTREEFREAGINCYKTFIQAMLDITDNLDGDKIIPPKDVVRRDGDDPYLVVAADKGTATFSDIANELSLKNNFWMGDAFASGGSAGYDHKKMGITARGAWESVKAHFRQLDHNIQEKPFDVVGVGDMGGDVFGNGMLLSDKIRLFGAFNHLHIFCDPDPDPATTFKERQRLFKEVKGWDHYDQKLLSKGGRIFSRADKTLELTPEICARFDIPKEKSKISPLELMNYMLQARTDLLWFGGIGTYIKSSKESHADAGDKANDAIRVNGAQIRAKVVGEGANLGVTQLGRVEYAEKGGRINTDFIDNSGGVNSSDLEVNIKILTTEIMRDKKHKMDTKARNVLLEQMTDDVSALVLRSNYQQAQAVSLIEHQARENIQAHNEFIQIMEREEGLIRKNEGLPDQDEIDARIRAGKGLTRPELSILLSYSKISFSKELLDSDIPDNLDMDEWLVEYFPKAMQEKYRAEIFRHKLRREIVATTISNSVVNRMGPTFVKSKMRKTGASCADVTKAYIVVRDAFGMRQLWDAIEGLDNKVPAEVQLSALRDTSTLIRHAVTWFLKRLGRPLDVANDTPGFKKGIETIKNNLDAITTEAQKKGIDDRFQAAKNNGLPDDLAREIALIPVLTSVCDIIRISLENKVDLLEAARTYFALGERFNIDWLRQQARLLDSDNHWHAEATNGLVDQLYGCQAGMTMRVLRDTGSQGKDGKSLLECWLDDNPALPQQFDPLFAELRRAGHLDLPMLVIAEQRLRGLYGG